MTQGTGGAGEEYVAGLLRKKGYKIVDRNYKTRFGEIDIIAKDDKYLVFVEVKTRHPGGMTDPLEAVTVSKQRKIILAAEHYLQRFGGPLQPRFDVAAVFMENGSVCAVNYITDAFQAG